MRGFLLVGIPWLAACAELAAAGLAADRAWWDAWGKTPEAVTAIRRAETCLSSPMPVFDASTYLSSRRSATMSSRRAKTELRKWARAAS